MSYRIIRTDHFGDQLNGIIFYIADDSGDLDTALNVLDRIEEAVFKLAGFPDRGNLPDTRSCAGRAIRSWSSCAS